MKVLLHTCCAGCAIYTFRALEKKFDRVTGLFFNPNIHPYSEFHNRREALRQFSEKYNKEAAFPEYRPEVFFHEINYKETKGQRCPICWRLRLKEAANFAKDNGYDAFTTTLLISPYQDHSIIKMIGEDLSKETGVSFYYEDLRAGFRDSQDRLKAEGLYSQKYCGCLYSEKERYERKGDKAKQKAKSRGQM